LDAWILAAFLLHIRMIFFNNL